MHGCFRQEVTSDSEGETQLPAPHQYLQKHPQLYIINAVYLHIFQAILDFFFRKITNLAVIYQAGVLILPKESDQKVLLAAEILRINLQLSGEVHVGKALQSHSGKSGRASVNVLWV